MKFVLNNSKAGKGAQDFLKESLKNSQDKFLSKENELKREENDLLSKKTILSREEYEKKIDELRKNVISYQRDRRESLDKIAKLKKYKVKSFYIRKLLHYSLNLFQNIFVKLLKKSGKFFLAVAYTTPANLLIEFDYLEISDVKIRITSKYEGFTKCLCYTTFQ